MITLSKYLSQSKKISRKRAELLIRNGFVTVNGITLKIPFHKLTEKDLIELKQSSLMYNQKIILLNKPKGCITTRKDEKQRTTIYDLLPKKYKNFHYVGRLDYNSEGILLLTENTNLKSYLENPKNKISRTYHVTVKGNINEKKIQKMNHNIYLDLKYKKPNISIIKVLKNSSVLQFTLHEGKNREIRKICDQFNLIVVKLIRKKYGKFTTKNIPLGAHREIIADESNFRNS